MKIKDKVLKEEKDTRPVRCYVCGKKMYYSGHSKHEPEYILTDDTHHFKGYVHKRCIEDLKPNKRRRKKR